MQTQDSVISAMEKIKYYETLSKGGGGSVPDRKFRSKAYSPTPYGNLKTPTSVTEHTPPRLDGRATSADKKYESQNVERTVAPVRNTETQHVTNLTARRTNGTAYDSNAKQKILCKEGTVTEAVAELKARPKVGKSSHIRKCMIPDNAVKAMPFESELAKETKHFNVQSGTIDVVKSTGKCLEMDETNSLSKPGDCKTKIYPDKTEHSYNEAVLFECKTGTDYTQCKRKTVPRSKLPVKTTNQEIKAVLNNESKHVKSEQIELISVEKSRCTRVSDSANNLRVNKVYEEHMEQKEKFETETERRQVEMENQLRSVCDILESIRAETEEIERIVENFADNVTDCITILHKSDNYESSEMNSDETNDRKFNRAYIKDEINEWLHQISEVKQNRIVSLIDLQRDMEEMNNFVKFLKQNNRKYTGEDLSYKGRSFAAEKTPLQTFETSVQTTKPFQNQKSSHISITEEQNRKGKGGGDFNLRAEGSDSAMEIIELLRGSTYQKAINASLDLALGSSLTAGEVSQKNNNHNKLVKHQKTLGLVKQRSVEELVSQSSLLERKSRIPKPTRQTYNNVSRDRKEFAHLEESSESGDYNRTLNSAKQIMQKHEIEIKRRATGESTTITDNSKKISTKNQRENTFYLKIKDIKPKIDTGLKTRSVGQTKVTPKDNLHSVHGRHTTKRKYESSRIPINSNSRIHY